MIITSIRTNNTFKNIQKPIFSVLFQGRMVDNFASKNEEARMNQNNYFCSSNNKENEKLKTEYAQKIKIMPLIMGSVMHSVKNYMDQKFDSDKFAEIFMQGASDLTKRIDLSGDKEEYCENYAPELNLISNINTSCNDFIQGEIQQDKLDISVENNVKTYTEDQTIRKKHFIA